MADNYATNQFYNFNKYEGTVFGTNSLPGVGAGDNPNFIYPSKFLRNAENGQSTPIQRGYLRMMAELLDQKYTSTLARRRLHFQFNPDSITRQVSARNDIQLWMNMDPSQITQPIPGDSNFAFELLFNREAEVISGKYANSSGNITAPAARTVSNVSDTRADSLLSEDSIAQFAQMSPSEIGVLADLIVFDELIGQGVNSQLIKNLADRAEIGNEYRATQKTTEDNGSTADGEDVAPKQQNTEKFDRKAVENALNANWGNSAFLISQPIRIVFSSLFMVEGYVTSTSVTFNKFTPTMVPVQAVVGIQMQAMYIGFARKDTFFTKTFKQNEEDYAKAVAARSAEERALVELGKKIIGKLEPDVGDENKVRIQDLVEQEKERTENAYISFKYSDAMNTSISKGSIQKIEAFGTLKVVYQGNSSSIPNGISFSVGDPVYDEETAIPLTLESDGKTRKIRFAWPSLQTPENIKHDTTSTSKYQYLLTVNFTITSPQGSQVEAAQTVTMDYTDSWGNAFNLSSKASLAVDPTSDGSSRQRKMKAL